jgi:hypothetical protein
MTVGIGLACHGGSCVVMAADGKGSFENDPSLSHERLGKQHLLPFGLYSNIAGTVKVCESFVNRLATALDAYPQKAAIRLDDLVRLVEDARFTESCSYIDAEMKENLKITLEQWRQSTSANLQYRRGNRIVRSGLPMEFIVGGIIRDSGCVVYFNVGETAHEGSLACIGIGGGAAYRWLIKRSQHVHMTIARTLLHVAEAMREARLAHPESVGDPANYVVITAKQTRRMPATDPTLQQMLVKYAGADTEEIDHSAEIQQAVQSAMYREESR